MTCFAGVGRRWVAALMAALMLTGCDTLFGDVGTLWGEEPQAVQEAAARPVVLVPVQSVRNIELGRTRDGFIITAFGTAPGLGYSLPSLRVRRDGAPGSDGFIEFDFVAKEPDPGFNLPPGSVSARELRADLPVRLKALQGAAGIRVLALQGGVQMTF